MEKERRLLKSAGTIGLVTTVSRIFGYFRDAALAWVLGAGMGMDAFAVAFRLANLFRRFVAEATMNAAFVPVFVQYRQEHTPEELWAFTRKFFYTLALLTSGIVLLEIILAPWLVRVLAPGFFGIPGKWELTVFLTRLMAPYLLFVALAAFLMGVLNSFGHFAVPALSPVFFNLAVILSAFTLAHFVPDPAIGIAFGVLCGGVLQFACQVPLAIRKGMRFQVGFSFAHPMVRRIGILFGPSALGMGIHQINLLVDSLMASFLREGSVSQLYYADRVMELVLGIFVISLITVALPEMSRLAAEKNIDEVKRTVLFSLRAMSFITIPATVGLFLLADPIVNVLFERGRFSPWDTEQTAIALAYYALGLFFISAVKLLISAFYSVQDAKTPVKVAAVSFFANLVLNWILMQPLKQGGIALATSIVAAASVLQLLIAFQKRHGAFDWLQFRTSFVKIAIASAFMGVGCLVMLRIFGFDSNPSSAWKAIIVFGTIIIGILVYLGMALVLRMDEMAVFKRFGLRSSK
ncbi:MAG: murein biosynthesis integral membrane protein MurJ [Candidatus Omnitrophica bacterium]|nr:murein biosynthesis integral membrane protein MurJ [Candidatus Omnitrophota bacterium]